MRMIESSKMTNLWPLRKRPLRNSKKTPPRNSIISKVADCLSRDIRTGKFSLIHSTAAQKLEKFKVTTTQRRKDEVEDFYNPEKALREMIVLAHILLEKIFIFFMGVYPGRFI